MIGNQSDKIGEDGKLTNIWSHLFKTGTQILGLLRRTVRIYGLLRYFGVVCIRRNDAPYLCHRTGRDVQIAVGQSSYNFSFYFAQSF